MGGFFATNEPNRISDGIAPFNKKGFAAPVVSERNGIYVASFTKLAVANHCNTYQHQDVVLIGIGSYGYRDQFATAALPLILHDHLAGHNPFAKVTGHAVFILQDGDTTRLITDKTGIYHCYCAEEGDKFYLSSSLLSVAGGVRKLRVSRQGVLEFLHAGATFGGDTIFSNIRHLPGGTVFRLKKTGIETERSYYSASDKEATAESIATAAVSYFDVFTNCPYPIMAELSGGRDSRTVVAALDRSGLDYEIGTNSSNHSYADDQKIAMQVASELNRPIAQESIYQRPIGELTEAQVSKGIYVLENCRNVLRAARHVDYFQFRASCASVIFGGAGAESLRGHLLANKFTSVQSMVAGKYVSVGIRQSAKQRAVYIERLSQKFNDTLDRLGESDVKQGVAKLYYYEKLRSWCGARVTSWNQYCFRIHPFLDHFMASWLFKIRLEEFRGHEYQRHMINLLRPGLGDIPFLADIKQSTDTSQSRWDAYKTMAADLPGCIRSCVGPRYMGGENSVPRRLSRLYDIAKKSKYRLARHLGDLATLKNLEPQFDGDLSEYLGVFPDDFESPGPYGAYLTVVRIVQHFKDKIDYGSVHD